MPTIEVPAYFDAASRAETVHAKQAGRPAMKGAIKPLSFGHAQSQARTVLPAFETSGINPTVPQSAA